MSEFAGFDWDRCNHENIGLPGCTTCDPQTKHWRIRLRFLESQRIAVRAAVLEERERVRSALIGRLDEIIYGGLSNLTRELLEGFDLSASDQPARGDK